MMLYLFLSFAALLVYSSIRSLLGGVAYLRYFREEIAKPADGPTPFVTIFAPCKGIEEGLRENLSALFDQDYPDYEVIFVIDDANDPAREAIDALLATNPNGCLVIAPKATESSQKVENLREAVLRADPRSEVFVFVDSDARPSQEWLRSLVDGVDDSSVGAATGYRWFIAGKPSLASELRSVWNASIASALGPNEDTNFCWAGSTAIRREVFESLSVREHWKGTVSDDFTLTRVVKRAGLRIKFVPRALTASIGSCDIRELLEFTTRQMKITRVYAPPLWVTSLIGASLYCVTIVWAFAIILTRPSPLAVFTAAATLLLVAVLGTAKAHLRLKAVRLTLPQYEEPLRRQTLSQLTLWTVTPFIFLFNCTSAAFSRSIRWRGTKYVMISDRETRVD